MGLFNFGKKEHSSVAIIHIGSAAVAGALVHLVEGEPVTMYYSSRKTIELRENEEASLSMLRTVEEVATDLVQKGAPLLRQGVGDGHIERIVVSVGTPWQKTSVRMEHVVENKPFTFTKAALTEILRAGTEVPEGYVQSGESVIATLLNGYEMSKPFGKQATRAEVIILSSLLEKTVAQAIEKTVRKTYHTHSLSLTAFAPLVYRVFRELYPHEKDFLVLHIGGMSTDIAFVKRGLLVDVTTVAEGIDTLVQKAHIAGKAPAPRSREALIDSLQNVTYSKEVEEAQKVWLSTLSDTLKQFAGTHALPRTLFLLAEEDALEYLRRLLDAPVLRSLWLTDEPLRVIPVTPAQFSSSVRTMAEAENDVFLDLLALFSKTHTKSTSE